MYYEQREKAYNSILKYDLKIVIGNFNAKPREYLGAILVERNTGNDNGKLLIGFPIEHDLRIASICFRQLNIHMDTWISPGDRTFNQIEHLLMKQNMLGLFRM